VQNLSLAETASDLPVSYRLLAYTDMAW